MPTSRESDAAAIRVAVQPDLEIGHLTKYHAGGRAVCRPPSGNGCDPVVPD
jgi:hypothetical protein